MSKKDKSEYINIKVGDYYRKSESELTFIKITSTNKEKSTNEIMKIYPTTQIPWVFNHTKKNEFDTNQLKIALKRRAYILIQKQEMFKLLIEGIFKLNVTVFIED
jgi:hypothetical protein